MKSALLGVSWKYVCTDSSSVTGISCSVDVANWQICWPQWNRCTLGRGEGPKALEWRLCTRNLSVSCGRPLKRLTPDNYVEPPDLAGNPCLNYRWTEMSYLLHVRHFVYDGWMCVSVRVCVCVCVETRSESFYVIVTNYKLVGKRTRSYEWLWGGSFANLYTNARANMITHCWHAIGCVQTLRKIV